MLLDIEGIDGAGKGTVTKALQSLMVANGHHADSVSFPDYTGSIYGAMVGRYLKGDFGDLHPSVRSLLYSTDRLEHRGMLQMAARQKHTNLICDRYVASNLAYASRGCPPEERTDVLKSIVHTEFVLFDLPVPDLLVVLDTPIDLASKNVAKKARRTYTDQTQDKHEQDTVLLREARHFYLEELLEFHPSCSYLVLDTSDGVAMLPPQHIASLIFSHFLKVQHELT